MKVYGGVMATLNVEPHHIIQGCRESAGACETIPGDPAQLSVHSCSGPRRLTVLILRPSRPGCHLNTGKLGHGGWVNREF